MDVIKDDPTDAVELLDVSDKMVVDLLQAWTDMTARLVDDDSVQMRSERGSAVKLLLQHLAVREAANQAVAERLDAAGAGALAARLEGAGVERRSAIARLDRLVRGRIGMNTNMPEVDEVVAGLVASPSAELGTERADLVAQAERALGGPGQRHLPSAGWGRTHSPRSRQRPRGGMTASDRSKPCVPSTTTCVPRPVASSPRAWSRPESKHLVSGPDHHLVRLVIGTPRTAPSARPGRLAGPRSNVMGG